MVLFHRPHFFPVAGGQDKKKKTSVNHYKPVLNPCQVCSESDNPFPLSKHFSSPLGARRGHSESYRHASGSEERCRMLM